MMDKQAANKHFIDVPQLTLLQAATPSQRNSILNLLDSRADLVGKPYGKRVTGLLDRLEEYGSSDEP